MLTSIAQDAAMGHGANCELGLTQEPIQIRSASKEMDMETETVPAAAVAEPDDLLATVLGRLPARSLAASRGVCKAWRDLIDDRQLLIRLQRLLPHSVRGLFIYDSGDSHGTPHFFSRPTPPSSSSSTTNRRRPRIPADEFEFEAQQDPNNNNNNSYQVMDHCNGLVLYTESNDGSVLHVCNPTTRWSARLPRLPGGGTCSSSTFFSGRRAFLVFDPFVMSPTEYKVLLPPHEPGKNQVRDDVSCRMMEWPPSPWKSWYEFSSSSGRWVEKTFVREGDAAVTAGDLLIDQFGADEPPYRYAAYWKGALYVHCHGEYVSRFSLLEEKYRVIKSPKQLADSRKNDNVRSFLGRSEKGVYIAAIGAVGPAKLRVWTLAESESKSGEHKMEWVPKDRSNLKINTSAWLSQKKILDSRKMWTLDLGNNGVKKKYRRVSQQLNDGWDSDDDDDDIMDVSYGKDRRVERIEFLGFHPYKEVIFLYGGSYAVACHLNSPKVQYLGSLQLPGTLGHRIRGSFVYTPCLIGD